MKRHLGLLLFLAVTLTQFTFGQARTASATIAASGNSQTLSVSGNSGTFEELISGSPATVSIVLKGCMSGGTCDTLETNTSTTAAQNRTPAIGTIYQYFTIAATWTGGTNVSIRVNATVATGQVSASAPLTANATLQPGSAVVGKVSVDQTTPGTTNAVEVTASTDSNIGLSSSSKATVTSSVNVKASAGNVYGVFFLNGAVAGCWLELINSATAGTLGTAVISNIPMASAGTQLLLFNPPIGGFTSGIAVGSATAVGGASACGTAATGVTILYK